MRTFVAALVASALVGLSTQTSVSDLPFTIDIDSFDISTLNGWCTSQINACDTLCDKDTKTNSCLPGPPPEWDCTCTSNSSAPGLQYYSSSIQSILCQQAFGQCQSKNAGDAKAQREDCEQGIQALCGTLNTADYESSSGSSETSSSVSSSAPSPTQSSSESSNTDAPGLAASVPVFATSGFVVVMAGLFAQLL